MQIFRIDSEVTTWYRNCGQFLSYNWSWVRMPTHECHGTRSPQFLWDLWRLLDKMWANTTSVQLVNWTRIYLIWHMLLATMTSKIGLFFFHFKFSYTKSILLSEDQLVLWGDGGKSQYHIDRSFQHVEVSILFYNFNATIIWCVHISLSRNIDKNLI